MSRIGKKPIEIPQGVEAQAQENRLVVKGPKGELDIVLLPEIEVKQEGKQLLVSPREDSLKAKERWGLTRTLISNMVEGVTKGYERKLEIEGIGYRAAVEGDTLVLSVGFSHPVRVPAPPGVTFAVDKNVITVSGINKELVGEIAARVRKAKKAEPYKGKGIKYEGEVIRRKEGKKAAT